MIGVPYVLAIVSNAANSRNVSARALATVCEAAKSFVVDEAVEVLLCAWLAIDVLNDSDRLALASDMLVDADWLVEADALAVDWELDVDAEVELDSETAESEPEVELLVDVEVDTRLVEVLIDVEIDSDVEVEADAELEVDSEVEPTTCDSAVSVVCWTCVVSADALPCSSAVVPNTAPKAANPLA